MTCKYKKINKLEVKPEQHGKEFNFMAHYCRGIAYRL